MAITEVTPDKDHSRARRRRKQDQSGDVAVKLVRGQPSGEYVANEDPCKQRHRERFDAPVDEEGNADTTPVILDLDE